MPGHMGIGKKIVLGAIIITTIYCARSHALHTDTLVGVIPLVLTGEDSTAHHSVADEKTTAWR